MFSSSSVVAQPMSAPSFAKDVTLTTFMADVIEVSKKNVVIVGFWAPWCGSCKQLAPVLEKVVNSYKGAVTLAKINIDQEQSIAQQMGVQSVPAVFAFFRGQPVDGFMGVQPEAQIKAWIDRLVKAVGGAAPEQQSGIDSALKQADDFLAAGDVATAQSIYADLIPEFPENAPAYIGYVKCLLTSGALDEAKQRIDQAPKAIAADKAFTALKTALDVAEQAKNVSGSLEQYLQAIQKDPADYQARLDLAMAYFAVGKREEAVDALLESVRRNRAWNEEAARKQLVKLFDVFGPTDPLTLSGRRRLSSILFS